MIKDIVNKLRSPVPIKERLIWKLYFIEIDRLMDRYYRRDPVKRSAVMLASSGRAGNTLFRFVWMNIISLKELGGRDVDFKMLYDNMPFDAYFNDFKKEWNFRSLPCLVKTHCPYSRRYAGFRAVHFFRNPMDTMVSLYEYLKNRVGGPKNRDFSWLEKKIFNRPDIRFKGTFSELLREDIDRYCAHFKSWMNSGAVPASYETLVSEDPYPHFDRIFRALGLEVEEHVLREAINRSQAERLRGKPQSEKMAQLDGMHFIRNGSVGQWRSYFSDEDVKFLAARLIHNGLSDIESFPIEYRSLLSDWPIAWLSNRV